MNILFKQIIIIYVAWVLFLVGFKYWSRDGFEVRISIALFQLWRCVVGIYLFEFGMYVLL